MLTDEIKKLIEDVYKLTPPNVGVGFGLKIRDNKITNYESIVFFVQEKKPLNEIPENEVLPDTEFVLSDRTLKTDVIEIGITSTFECNPICNDWMITPPANRQYIRPIKGGISITSQTHLGFVGTLGLIAVDQETQALVGVTNNHVVVRDAFYTSQRNPSGVIENEYDINDGASRDPDIVYQSGETINPPLNNKIGEVIRYVPIYDDSSGKFNKVDGALISVDCDSIDITQSFKQFGLDYNLPYEFATTYEIDNLLNTIPRPMLYSSGRTTGVKQGLPCPLRVGYVGTILPVYGYNKQNTLFSLTFRDIITFVKPENDPDLSTICPYPIHSGDSGSALVADFNGVSKIIGLVFAGSMIGGVTYYGHACRIDHVAEELGIEAWNGSVKPFVDPSTITYTTLPTFNDIKTVNEGGKTYWQCGATNL